MLGPWALLRQQYMLSPPLPSFPRAMNRRPLLVVRGPPSMRFPLMLLNQSPGKVGPSNAVTCSCCMTSPAECWRKDLGTATAGLSANRRWLWHICFSCQSVRRALEVRDKGRGNSTHFKVCGFFPSLLFNKFSLFAVCIFRNNLHCSGPMHWLRKTRFKLRLNTMQCGAFPKALTFFLLLSSKMLTAYLVGLTTAGFCLPMCKILLLAEKKKKNCVK